MRVVSHLGFTIANELMPHFNDFIVYLRNVAIETRPAVMAALPMCFVHWAKPLTGSKTLVPTDIQSERMAPGPSVSDTGTGSVA